MAKANARARGQAEILRGDRSADPDEQFGIAEAYEGQKDLLKTLPKAKLPSDAVGRHGGYEHEVFVGQDGFFYKATKPDSYGVILRKITAPFGHFYDLTDALPSEYLERIALANEHFGSAIELLGVDDKGRFITRQPDLTGPAPTPKEIEAAMKKAGFRKVEPSLVDNEVMKNLTWESDGLLVSDAKPANFVKTSEGLVGIDLLVRKKS